MRLVAKCIVFSNSFREAYGCCAVLDFFYCSMSLDCQVVRLVLYHEDILCWYHWEGAVLVTQYSSGDKIEKNGMGGAFNEYWREGGAYTGCWWGNPKGRDHLGDPAVDGRIILRRIFRKWHVGLWTGSSRLRVGTGGGIM
jgi:hypothetical protein